MNRTAKIISILIGLPGLMLWGEPLCFTRCVPEIGRPYGQPALALRAEPASGLVGSRFDQAQGR